MGPPRLKKVSCIHVTGHAIGFSEMSDASADLYCTECKMNCDEKSK